MIKTYNSRCSVLPPKKLDRKNLTFWGVFIMKLSYDDKVQIYELRKQGYSLEKLSNKWLFVNCSGLKSAKLEKGQILSFLF